MIACQNGAFWPVLTRPNCPVLKKEPLLILKQGSRPDFLRYLSHFDRSTGSVKPSKTGNLFCLSTDGAAFHLSAVAQALCTMWRIVRALGWNDSTCAPDSAHDHLAAPAHSTTSEPAHDSHAVSAEGSHDQNELGHLFPPDVLISADIAETNDL